MATEVTHYFWITFGSVPEYYRHDKINAYRAACGEIVPLCDIVEGREKATCIRCRQAKQENDPAFMNL